MLGQTAVKGGEEGERWGQRGKEEEEKSGEAVAELIWARTDEQRERRASRSKTPRARSHLAPALRRRASSATPTRPRPPGHAHTAQTRARRCNAYGDPQRTQSIGGLRGTGRPATRLATPELAAKGHLTAGLLPREELQGAVGRRRVPDPSRGPIVSLARALAGNSGGLRRCPEHQGTKVAVS